MDEATAMMHEQVPYTAVLGVTVGEFTPERVILHGDWRAERCTVGGVMHGGYLMAVADCAAAGAALLNLPADAAGTATIEAKTNMMRAVREGRITATAHVVHAGRTTIVVQADITDESDRLVSRTLQTQAVLR